jgi:hypothetical protein
VAITFPGEFRPGGATSPQATPDWYLKFLSAEADETAALMGFFEQGRLELETFIRTGDLTMSDAVFYRDLLDETNRVASGINRQSATWTSSVIPEAYSSGRRLTSSVVIPENALRALSKDPLRLLTDVTDDMRLRVRQGIATGILEGLSGAELRARIVSTGLTNIPRWPSIEYRAGVIARTETMKAFNGGAIAGYVDNGARFVRWIASPDEATCPICLPRDGEVFRLGGGPVGSPRSAVKNGKLPAGFLYHGTPIENMAEIKQRGLVPGKFDFGGPQQGVFFARADTPDAALDRGRYNSATGEEGETALLRVPESAVPNPVEILGDPTSTEAIPSELIEYWTADKAWSPIGLFAGGAVSASDPYPAAQPLPSIPAHPRCRCTTRAEYRDKDGNVIREGAGPPPVEVDPKLSQGDMGADHPPELPPAVGDFTKAVGRLKDPKLVQALEDSASLKSIVGGPFSTPAAVARYNAAEAYLKTERAFWRNLPRLTDDQIKIIAGVKGNGTMDGYLISRWGSRFVGTGWNADAKFYTIRALERIHALNPGYLKDSPFLQFIGKAPPGSRVGGNAIAAAWSSGYIGVSMTKWKTYLAGKTLRGGPGVNAGEEVILHEFMHALHSEFGMSAQLRYFGPQKGTTQWPAVRATSGGLQEKTFESAWRAIQTRREIAPDVSKITFYEEQIASFRASRERYLAAGQPVNAYDDLIQKYELKIYEIRDAITNGGAGTGPDYYPTSYAQSGGYAEDFAESAMLFFLNPNALRKWAPARYEFILREIWNGVEP